MTLRGLPNSRLELRTKSTNDDGGMGPALSNASTHLARPPRGEPGVFLDFEGAEQGQGERTRHLASALQLKVALSSLELRILKDSEP